MTQSSGSNNRPVVSNAREALNKFKTEFSKFTVSLDKVGKQVNTVAITVEDSIKKTKRIQKVLNNISEISHEEMSIDLIGGIASDEIIDD